MLKRLAVLAALTLLSACGSLLGPRDVNLPVERMQISLDRKFPVHHRVLEVFDVDLTRPRLTLVPDSERVVLGMDAAMRPRFGGGTWNGALTMSGRLAIDHLRNAVTLQDARLDQFYLDRLDSDTQKQLSRVANLLMQRLLGDVVLYNFKPEDLRLAGVQFTPTSVKVGSQALVVHLEPERR
jgi:hypothetical protein